MASVRVHSSIISCLPSGVAMLWGYARALDIEGRGLVQFSITDCADYYGRSPISIKRWLRESRQHSVLRHYQIKDGIATCYLASVTTIAIRHGISDLGGIAEVPLTALKHPSILATEIAAQYLQARSRFAAKVAGKKLGKAKVQVNRVEELLSPSGNLAGVLGQNSRYLFIKSDVIPFGVAQPTIAAHRQVSIRTIQRHTSNAYRAGVTPAQKSRQLAPLPPLLKRQIAHEQPSHTSNLLKLRSEWAKDLELRSELSRYVKKGERIFYLCCNLYYPDLDLLPARNLRKRLKHKLSLSSVEAEPKNGFRFKKVIQRQ